MTASHLSHMPFIHYIIPSLPWMVVRGTRAKSNPRFQYLIQCETFRSCFSYLIVDREQFPFEYYQSYSNMHWIPNRSRINVSTGTIVPMRPKSTSPCGWLSSADLRLRKDACYPAWFIKVLKVGIQFCCIVSSARGHSSFKILVQSLAAMARSP